MWKTSKCYWFGHCFCGQLWHSHREITLLIFFGRCEYSSYRKDRKVFWPESYRVCLKWSKESHLKLPLTMNLQTLNYTILEESYLFPITFLNILINNMFSCWIACLEMYCDHSSYQTGHTLNKLHHGIAVFGIICIITNNSLLLQIAIL